MAQVRTRKRGKTWSYIFEAGKVDGKRKVVEKGGYPTKAAAYKAGVSAYNDWLHGNIGITSEAISLADFMTTWLENVVSLDAKPTSMQRYRSNFINHILLQLGKVKVQELTPAILDAWMRDFFSKGYSFYTLSGTYSLLKQALNYAVYPAQLISSNPAAYIKVPKKSPRNIVKRHIISLECFGELLKKFPFGTTMYIPLLLLYHTGMRLGEVLGLTWEDIDFDKREINLRQQIVFISGKGWHFTTLKTESSNRKIMIDTILIGELRRWQVQQGVNEQTLGGSYVYVYRTSESRMIQQSACLPLTNGQRLNMVCVKKNGRVVTKSNVIRYLRLEGLNPHSFRHTHATQLIESGATPKGVADRLGHANVAITQNLYTHTTETLMKDTVAIFEQSMQANSSCRQGADK